MNTFFNDKFAPARKIIEDRINAIKAGRVKIGYGSGMEDVPYDQDMSKLPPNKTLCIMELTAYVLGYRINDHPPCTSEVIRDFLVDVNDLSISNRKRSQLKALIPEIINTAPTKWDTRRTPPRLVTAASDKEYQKIEQQRLEMLRSWKTQHETDNDFWDDCLVDSKFPMGHVLDIARQMADVARFDGRNEATERAA